MSAKHWICVCSGVLLAFCIACGGLGSSGHSDNHHGGSLSSTDNHHKDDNPKGGVKKSKDDKRQRLSQDGEKPLPNTVALPKPDRNFKWTLYRPAEGYVWSDSGDNQPRTWETVVPAVKRKK